MPLRDIYIASVLLIASSVSGHACDNHAPTPEPLEKKRHVYLLIGDDSMAGQITARSPMPRLMKGGFLLNADNQWEALRPPLNRYSSITDTPGRHIGPGQSFAAALLAANPDSEVGLVVNASHTTHYRLWGYKSAHYRATRKRLRAAMRQGSLKGVVWMSNETSYGTAPIDHLKTLIANLRMDSGQLNLPVVIGASANNDALNAQFHALTQDVHAVSVAEIDIPATTGKAVYNAGTITALGQRFAEEMITLQKGVSTHELNLKSRSMPLIDTHVHAFHNKKGGLDDVDAWMKKNNIAQCLVSPIGDARATTDEQRAIMLANYAPHKGRIHRFCLLEPGDVQTVEEAVTILHKEKEAGAVAFGEHYGRNMMFDDPRNMLLYAACEKVGLPVMFHIDQNKNMDEKGLPRVERVLKTYPDCVLIAHAFWWLQLPEGTCDYQLQKHPNLYADFSGMRMAGVLNRDRRYTRDFLIRNQDKILFGSDAGWWSFGKAKGHEVQFRLLEEFDLPKVVLEKIYYKNAQKVFGLKGRLNE